MAGRGHQAVAVTLRPRADIVASPTHRPGLCHLWALGAFEVIPQELARVKKFLGIQAVSDASEALDFQLRLDTRRIIDVKARRRNLAQHKGLSIRSSFFSDVATIFGPLFI